MAKYSNSTSYWGTLKKITGEFVPGNERNHIERDIIRITSEDIGIGILAWFRLERHRRWRCSSASFKMAVTLRSRTSRRPRSSKSSSHMSRLTVTSTIVDNT